MGFECEPRKTTPDFLTGISNPQERLVREGFEGKVPENSVELEQAYLESEAYSEAMKELNEYEETIKQEVCSKYLINFYMNNFIVYLYVAL